ncbi:MAG: hypothetical protein AVW06_01275 [Hadesarchaea archaeon DG-33-1]|nr:MAG: hypothetical protein AVW06_01275 [Hadesarchaea archaeon DG-33-1]
MRFIARETTYGLSTRLIRGDVTSSEFRKAAKEVRRVFKDRGSKVLEEAMASIRRERIECDETREAISHFISYWHDILRPSLVSLACEAVGGNPSIMASTGGPLTLLSGATDIHDDIVDKTMIKEKRHTVPGKFGGNLALLAGDALVFKGFAELFEGLMRLNIPLEEKLAVVRTINRLYFEMCDGEALELKFRARTDVKPGEYLYVIRKKAADIEVCTRVGAMLGRGKKEQIDALGEYGRLLGMIILLRNDLEDLLDLDILNLRIKNESLPLPLLFALEDKGKKSKILAILKKVEVRREEAKRLFALVSEAGGVVKLGKCLESLKNEAILNLEVIENKEIFIRILQAAIPLGLPLKKS